MKKVLIFGHRKPDTDSVMSAIGLSYLKNSLGENTEARILGDVNRETSYALNYFNISKPKYLNDVKLQLKDVNYHKGFYIKDTASIYDAYQAMLKNELTGVPVVKDDNTFLGLVTLKDLSKLIINEHIEDLDTSYDNLLHVLDASCVYKASDEISGRLLVAAYRSTTFMSNILLNSDSIMIVGDRHSVIEYAVNSSVKMIILTGDAYIKDEHIEIAKNNGVNIIKTPYDTYHVSRLVALSNYVKNVISIFNPVKFLDTDFLSNILEINNKLKHTNYPVVDKKNRCLGLLKVTDLNDKNPKKVILVDHNEKLQSVEGLDEAEILEIFDHHNLGSITTNNPINFRNMSVGSTCTIVYTLFKERNVKIPKNIAGALLSGILSDTLILKSPTKTSKDLDAVLELSKICEIDYFDYGMKLLKSGTSLDGMSLEDVLYNDFKLYNVSDKSFAVGQFFTMNFDEINAKINDYIDVLDKVASANNYSLVALYVTDIIKNGSYVIYNRRASSFMNLVYENINQGSFIPGCVSRKIDVIPLIMEVMES